jgi:integrase
VKDSKPPRIKTDQSSYALGITPLTIPKQSENELSVNVETLVNNQPNYIKKLYRQVSDVNSCNVKIIHDYIIAEEAEINIQESTKGDKIKKLCLLSRYFDHRKSFSEMTKTDILGYPNSLRKPLAVDPTHGSIGTYNGRQMVFMKFFRWLYNSDEPDHRKRITPPCMMGVKGLPRREKSPYKPEDIWTYDDHVLFLKYCHMARDRCWHSMVCDTSARPHEIINLRIGDINFKISHDGIQYAVIHVHGKTTPRTLPLITCIPYLKEWLGIHPFASNHNSKLFVSLGRANYGQPLTRDGMLKHYQSYYRDIYFPKLMENPIIPTKEKEAISRLLNKPWNLYIFRHSSLTQKSQILKEATLRDHAGWSINSKMPSVYLHYFGTESCNSLLETFGLVKKQNGQASLQTSKLCPSCKELNKQDSRFCVSCKMVLTYDAYNETLEKEQKRESEVQHLKDRYDLDIKAVREQMNQIMMMVQRNPRLANIKPEVLVEKSQ